MRAYKFALDPSHTQFGQFNSHVGGAAKAYNWALGRVKDSLETGEKISWSHISLRNEWNDIKNTVAINRETGEIWWPANSKWVYDSAIADAATALANWNASRKNARKGPKMGFAKFKSKRNPRKSCRFLAGVRVDGPRALTMPRIGSVRTHESTKKLARKVAQGGVIKSATLSVNAVGRWFLSVLVDCPDRIRSTGNEGGPVGIDLGLKTLAVVADTEGKVVHTEPNNKHLKESLTRLRRAQRVASRRVGDKHTPNSNRKKQANLKVARIHNRVANLRSDQIHKFTDDMAKRFPIVVVEDLNVKGMVKNRKMARAVSDAAFGEIRRQLCYKVETVFVADRWFASSKTCSNCGAVKAKLHLGERTYECESCGLVIDRDVNAARNLARVALIGNAVGYTVSGRGLRIGPVRGQQRLKRLATISSQPAPAERLVGS